MRALRSKILGPLFAAQLAAPRMTAPGSITFTSGVAAYRPAPGGMLAATVNGALESMVRALALELGPVRVNAVSPGWVDTPVWNQLASPEVKQARLADMAARLPGRRIGQPEDIDPAFVAGDGDLARGYRPDACRHRLETLPSAFRRPQPPGGWRPEEQFSLARHCRAVGASHRRRNTARLRPVRHGPRPKRRDGMLASRTRLPLLGFHRACPRGRMRKTCA